MNKVENIGNILIDYDLERVYISRLILNGSNEIDKLMIDLQIAKEKLGYE